jgi:predicted Ser/Thr protein kinase
MKKIILGCLIAISVASITPVAVHASVDPKTKKEVVVTAAQAERSKVITARLYEIKAMDKSTMSSSEKKALRKEVKAMKKEANSGNGGIYISVGAAIIIILLLILIL